MQARSCRHLLDVGGAALQMAAFPVGQATPNTVGLIGVKGVVQAFDANFAAGADLRGQIAVSPTAYVEFPAAFGAGVQMAMETEDHGRGAPF